MASSIREDQSPMLEMIYISLLQDHPVVGRPCFMLHPCQTAELLDLMLPSLRLQHSASRRAAAQMAPPDQNIEERPEGQRQAKTAVDEAGSRCGNSAASFEAGCWQGRYMAAWWSVVGPALGLPRPGSSAGAAEDGVQRSHVL